MIMQEDIQASPLIIKDTSLRGIGSHHSPRAITDTWLTPPWLLKALGEFDLDPCAAPDPRPWDTAKRHYTAPHEDGLRLPWFNWRVFLNPPYGRQMGAWLKKLGEHGRGTALIFARTETSSFSKYVFGQADALLFLKGRLFFHYPDGRPAKANGGAPSVLCAYGPEDTELLYASGLEGHFVGLKAPVLLHLAMVADPPPVQGWKDVVKDALMSLGGKAKLTDLYSALESHPKSQRSPHWREKIRQTVGRLGLPRVGTGQYSLEIA